MKISIVTVVLNDKEGLRKTMEGIVNQTCRDFESIIIDGFSTDGTREDLVVIDKKLAEKNIEHTIVSEKDSGIYNAMNKGIKIATGDYVIFMNAGDEFFDNEVIEKLVAGIDSSADVVYGDVINVLRNGKEAKGCANKIDTITEWMPFCHQSCLVKKAIIKDNLFDEKYKIVADYGMMLGLYLKKRAFQYLPLVISKFYSGGACYRQWLQLVRENIMVRAEFGLTDPNSKENKAKIRKVKIKEFIKKFIPDKILIKLGR